jgi:hypothetical protein
MASGSSITRGAGTSALTVTGTSTLANSVITSGAQTYQGAVTLAAATTSPSTRCAGRRGTRASSSQPRLTGRCACGTQRTHRGP